MTTETPQAPETPRSATETRLRLRLIATQSANRRLVAENASLKAQLQAAIRKLAKHEKMAKAG